MRRLRDAPWTVWLWMALVALEAGVVALPGAQRRARFRYRP